MNASRVFKECFKSASRVFYECFESASSVFDTEDIPEEVYDDGHDKFENCPMMLKTYLRKFLMVMTKGGGLIVMCNVV